MKNILKKRKLINEKTYIKFLDNPFNIVRLYSSFDTGNFCTHSSASVTPDFVILIDPETVPDGLEPYDSILVTMSIPWTTSPSYTQDIFVSERAVRTRLYTYQKQRASHLAKK